MKFTEPYEVVNSSGLIVSALPFLKKSKVEYAIKAIQLGSTAIGVKTSEGIVLAVEKRVSSVLMEAGSVCSTLEMVMPQASPSITCARLVVL